MRVMHAWYITVTTNLCEYKLDDQDVSDVSRLYESVMRIPVDDDISETSNITLRNDR